MFYTGLLSNWAVTPVFSRHFFVATWTVPLYAVADTVLQGVFCLGAFPRSVSGYDYS